MMLPMHSTLLLIVSLVAVAGPLRAAEPTAEQLAHEVIAQAGGEAQLLRIFRFREQVLITDQPQLPPAAGAPGNRTSIVEAGGGWWVGNKPRPPETAHVLVWGWSLRVLLDPDSRLERLADTVMGDIAVFGLRVTGSTKEPLDLWFDAATKRLVAIDYIDSRNFFSDWKTTADGRPYPAHVAGYRFADAQARTTKPQQWYQTDLLELTPLAELPAGLEL